LVAAATTHCCAAADWLSIVERISPSSSERASAPPAMSIFWVGRVVSSPRHSSARSAAVSWTSCGSVSST